MTGEREHNLTWLGHRVSKVVRLILAAGLLVGATGTIVLLLDVQVG